jgi:hypothetical protein
VPTSDKQGKLISRLLIEHHNPRDIVDVGPGEGTYWDLMNYSTLDTFWSAVEIWEPYVQEFNLGSKYDVIVIDDIRNVQFKPYTEGSDNLIIFGDVLEHMPEDDARQLILKAKQHFRWILVSIPIVHAPQGEVNGNPYEAHVKHWDFDEMHAAMGHCMAFKGHTIGLYWWDSEEDV